MPEPLRSSGGLDFPQQRGLVDEIDEGAFPVDLHHWKPLPVASLEIRDPRDVHNLVPDPEPAELLLGPIAQPAALGGIEDDPRDTARA